MPLNLFDDLERNMELKIYGPLFWEKEAINSKGKSKLMKLDIPFA